MHPILFALALSAAGHESIHVFEGTAAADRTGASVAAAGDIDGDGRADVVIGAPRSPLRKPGAGEPAGSVRVLSGATGALLLLLDGGDAYDAFGTSVDGAGDLDGDGFADILVGSPAGEPPGGSVHAISGQHGTTLWMRAGGTAGDRYGHAVARVDDLDGDGRNDVLVGAPHADTNGWNSGRVELLSGATGALLRAIDGTTGDFFGMSLAGLDDLDGDGLAEYVVGAPFSDAGAFNAGSAFVFAGLDGSRLFAFHGENVGDQLGHAVCAAGDADADGVGDVGLAAPGADQGHLDAGVAEVRSGANGDRLWSVDGGASGVYLSAIAGLGDLDLDGHDDLLVGIASADAPAGPESGRVRVISGRTGCALLDVPGSKSYGWFGAAVSGAGDIDGDGRVDWLVGAPGHDDHLSRPGRVEVLRATSLDPCR